MRREKRTAKLQAYVPPSMRKQLELFAKERSNVISLSDYLFELVEEHIAVRTVKQTLGRRVGNQ